MKKLDFVYPFTAFNRLNFTNCFTSLYMHLEKYTDKYESNCKEFCCYCGMCKVPWAGVQTRLYFLFDTITGRSAAQNSWGNKRTDIFNEVYENDETIDFLFGYTGYGYEKYTEDLGDKIRVSIDGGTPALVRVKDSGNDTFRIIIGYSNENFIQATKPEGWREVPDTELTLEEIIAFYQVTGKTKHKYTLVDGLKRIKRVLEFNRDTNLWDEYINAFKHDDVAKNESPEETQRRFDTAKDAMIWNCHNFGMAMGVINSYEKYPKQFENRIWDEWKNPAFLPAFDRIGGTCDFSHTKQWQIHALQKVCVKSPTEKHDMHTEWGLFECAKMIFPFLKDCDEQMYLGVCEMIDCFAK